MIDLSGKTALVTGAAEGIGRGCAEALIQAGARVVLNDRPGNDLLQATANEIGAEAAIAEDVFERAGCERLVDETLRHCERLDILISSPAFSRRGRFLEYPPELWQRTLDGTLSSAFHMSQLVARQLVERKHQGALLFISSVQAEMPIGLSAAYGAAKAGLNHLTRSIAVELAPYRIRANAIEPGWIDTPGERRTFGDENVEAAGEQLPWGRLGQPADIGRAAAFLVSDAADYITGTVLPVDGCFRFKDCLVENAITPDRASPPD